MALRSLRPDSHIPISPNEFYDAVTNLWKIWRVSKKPSKPSRIALAVSGGPDSMALAFLCKQLISERLIPDLNVKPFIVDHKAREGSTEEAHNVASWLKDLGFEPSILTLRWASGTIPSSLSNFETSARKYRYQMLGHACKEYNIQALFLGHHQDDTVETVLSRLVRGQRQASGFTGVASVGHIPECHGIYGLAESGSFIKLKNVKSRIDPAGRHPVHDRERPDESQLKQAWGIDSNTPHSNDILLPISDGGIYLFRPFSSFPKSRLTSTCLQNNIKFAIDKTNFDPTVTSRNTLRYLLSNDMLPRALRAPSILQLIENSKQVSEELNRQSNIFLRKSQIIKLDLRTGSLVINFPNPRLIQNFGVSLDDPVGPASVMTQKAMVITLRRFLDVILPGQKNHVPFHKFKSALQIIFPASEAINGEAPPPLKMDIFTVDGVKFEPVKVPKKRDAEPHLNLKAFKSRKQNDATASISEFQNTWLLTRAPFPRRLPLPTASFNLQLPDLSIADHVDSVTWSDWQLWDNRYWIRLGAEKVPRTYPIEEWPYEYRDTPVPLVVRPMKSLDLAEVRKQLLQYQIWHHENHFSRGVRKVENQSIRTLRTRKILDQHFWHHAPDKLRYTIPVIAEATGQQRVLAFPSFGERMPVTLTRGIRETSVIDHWWLNWQISYKNIEEDVLKLASRDLGIEIRRGIL
ncbi:tRNA(Ile)-lysidine synthetase [Paracoccidioides brasiliensis Pb03]|nr:tRNA(Ile)-lysidine synthetase [Paracoccidioides brasiliensis Pb03]